MKKDINIGPKCLVTGGPDSLGGRLPVLFWIGIHSAYAGSSPGGRSHKRVQAFTGDLRDYDTVLGAAHGAARYFIPPLS